MGSNLEKIQKKKEKLEALQKEIKQLINQETLKKRKQLTRQKIILGAALLSHAENDEKFQKVVDILKSHLSEKDKKAFE
ncbi:mobilization protein (plasmid) [Acetobacteraceae bacterium]|nr:mobilization protein [Acetobacteraceae bacterium]QCE35845.1 mobilization protein [Acetobacteraceae bacterium]